MTLSQAEQEAMRARQGLAELDHESDCAREAGISLSEAFYAAMGRARVSVNLAERVVRKMSEVAE